MNDIALVARNGKFACSTVDSGAQKGPTGLMSGTVLPCNT